MVQSMTGFTSHSFNLDVQSENLTVTISLKSLNARFFECTCKLSHALSILEPVMVKKLRDKLFRGTIQCNIFITPPTILSSKPIVSKSALNGYLEAAGIIASSYKDHEGFSATLDINTLLNLPHVIEFSETAVDQAILDAIINQLDSNIDKLIHERVREGEALARDLTNRLHDIEQTVALIKERSGEVFSLKKEKLINDMKLLFREASVEAQEHHIQLIYNQLEKLDITEEIVRLSAHIENARQALSSKKTEKGKQLDFTFQEMFREINTIGAKCADSILSNLAIAVKVELEKSREQIQNIV